MTEPKPRGEDPRAPKHQTPDSTSGRGGMGNRSRRKHREVGGVDPLAHIVPRTAEQVDKALQKAQEEKKDK